DLEWIERLFALLALGERFVTTLGLFLSLGVVLAIGNTIRLAIENRRAEIEIIKLVGATDAFVRRPFLYLGFWYGFGGALVAWLMVQASLIVLSGPIEQLLDSYQNQFLLEGLDLITTLTLFGVGIGLGVVGAAVAVGRHLHTIEPN
ncbi:MAG: cell division transport system permease protein, partial [Candidatus Azotimanducaceae bacterium]